MNFDDLSPEQLEKVKSCQTPEELVKLVTEEGHELSDDDLEAVSGGSWGCDGHVCEGYADYVHC